MCGIIGIIGRGEVADFLVDGLKRLEYRGYDSAGVATLVDDGETLAKVLAWENAKYETDYSIDVLDPMLNSCFRVDPVWAFGIAHDDFTGSPTRWEF